jgi:hypothetical protein
LGATETTGRETLGRSSRCDKSLFHSLIAFDISAYRDLLTVGVSHAIVDVFGLANEHDTVLSRVNLLAEGPDLWSS